MARMPKNRLRLLVVAASTALAAGLGALFLALVSAVEPASAQIEPPPDPEPPPEPPILAAAGDIACDPRDPNFRRGRGKNGKCRQLYTSRLLEGADTVFPLGDNQYEHGTRRKFRRSYDRSWGRFRSSTKAVIGNHEYGPPTNPNLGPGGYFGYFGRARAGRRGRGWHSFDVEGWHVIALNSQCRGSNHPRTMQPRVGCGPGSAQYRFLRRDLRRNAGECIVAGWHHPRFSSGSVTNGSGEVRPLWQALDQAGADVVLSGHDHVYERFTRKHANGDPSPNGIRQFVVGTGGESLGRRRNRERGTQEFISSYGVLRLELRPNSYTWEFVTTDGRVRDSGFTPCRG
jgi:acid phosphatase type 7